MYNIFVQFGIKRCLGMKYNKDNIIVALIVVIFLIFNIIIFTSLFDIRPDEEKLKPKIVLISHVYTNPYWQYVKMGAEKAAKERGAIISYEGPNVANAEEGVKLINMAYASKASGIITYVQEEEKYIKVINKVVESGIPLLTIDSDAEKSKRIAYIGTDNVQAGVEAAKEMIKRIGQNGNVGIIMGGKSVKNQIERVKGFKEYIEKNSKINISDIESSDSYLIEAELAAKKILTNNLKIDALLCTSALDGPGAAKAVMNMGLSGKVKIISFDDLPETLEYIEKGIITSTVVQRPYNMGYIAVNIMMNIIEGKKEEGIYYTDVVIVGKENVDEFKKQQGDYKNE